MPNARNLPCCIMWSAHSSSAFLPYPKNNAKNLIRPENKTDYGLYDE